MLTPKRRSLMRVVYTEIFLKFFVMNAIGLGVLYILYISITDPKVEPCKTTTEEKCETVVGEDIDWELELKGVEK